MMDDGYNGFTNCKYVAKFENDLRLRRILRRNAIKQSTEAILDPGKFLGYVAEIRSKLEYRRSGRRME